MSSVINILLGFIFTLSIGYIVVKNGGKLRYLAPICFIGVTCIALFLITIFFRKEWEKAQFFSQWTLSLNNYAESILILAFSFAGLATFFLIVGVWAVRKKVFF